LKRNSRGFTEWFGHMDSGWLDVVEIISSPDASTVAAIGFIALAAALGYGYVPIEGPPGTGKTTLARTHIHILLHVSEEVQVQYSAMTNAALSGMAVGVKKGLPPLRTAEDLALAAAKQVAWAMMRLKFTEGDVEHRDLPVPRKYATAVDEGKGEAASADGAKAGKGKGQREQRPGKGAGQGKGKEQGARPDHGGAEDTLSPDKLGPLGHMVSDQARAIARQYLEEKKVRDERSATGRARDCRIEPAVSKCALTQEMVSSPFPPSWGFPTA
jgi:Mg-chelatase subunit ChlI